VTEVMASPRPCGELAHPSPHPCAEHATNLFDIVRSAGGFFTAADGEH
jgi:hypothetical protein